MRFIREIISEKRQMEENAKPGFIAPPRVIVPVDDVSESDIVGREEADSFAENETSDGLVEFLSVEEARDDAGPETDRTGGSLEDLAPLDSKPLVLENAYAVGFGEEGEEQDSSDNIFEAASEDDIVPDADPVPQWKQETKRPLGHSFRDVNESLFREVKEDQPQDQGERISRPGNAADTMAAPRASHSVLREPVAADPQEATGLAAERTGGLTAPQKVEVPRPALGRGASGHGRVKTRLLGFNMSAEPDIDPIKSSAQAAAAPYTRFPVGWLIVIEGEGRGACFTLFNGLSNIGRGTTQTVCLDFGDNSISRDAHASIAYDPRGQTFFLGHCGKANIVRRNDRPVLSTEELFSGDHITIGETTLRFVAFCGQDFSWEKNQGTCQAYATGS